MRNECRVKDRRKKMHSQVWGEIFLREVKEDKLKTIIRQWKEVEKTIHNEQWKLVSAERTSAA